MIDELDMNLLEDLVISGMDDDLMDMTTIKTDAPVINARGMTAIQIRNEIDRRKL